jgi:hypothetical protein
MSPGKASYLLCKLDRRTIVRVQGHVGGIVVTGANREQRFDLLRPSGPGQERP